MTFLAGDLGGTKTLLALCNGAGEPLCMHQYDSRAHDSLEDMVAKFLRESDVQRHPHPQAAGLGVAGPIREEPLPEGGGITQRATITNLGYEIDALRLRERFAFRQVKLANDFYALSLYAARVVQQIESRTDAEGRLPVELAEPVALIADSDSVRPDPQGNLCVLGAGTGMGQALIVRGRALRLAGLAPGQQPLIVATEGGHTDFAPRDALELDLLRFLLRRHPEHVSVERVICGAGLHMLYEFFAEREPERVSPQVAAEIEAAGSSAPSVVSAHGLAGTDLLCQRALERFVMLYGAEAGNLALKSMATGGVVIGGGVARKILPRLRAGLFREHFLRKGRFRGLCERMPIYVLLDPLAGLRGAAYLVCDVV
jgi:glucokinase